MDLTADSSRSLADRLLGRCRADTASVRLTRDRTLQLRVANNDVSTNGQVERFSGSLTVSFDRRSATVGFNQTDDETLSAVVARAETLARLAPENPEFMPPPEPAAFAPPGTYAETTAAVGPAGLVAHLRPVVEAARTAGVDGAGFLVRRVRESALAASTGLFVFQPSTTCGFSMTARTRDGGGSGWASTEVTDTESLDLMPVGRRAIDKAIRSCHPASLKPGRKVVLLEPAAVRDLLSLLAWSLDRRSLDEKRSFLTPLSPERSPVGQALFGTRATLFSDPGHPAAPCATHGDGIPRGRTPWIEDGVLRHLHVGRYWASQVGVDPLPGPGNLILAGQNLPLEALIRRVDDGVLITRLWYIRLVRPESLLYTGLTRDGTFRIRNGAVEGPVTNFRFNESPVTLLRGLVASGVAERVMGSESGMPTAVPPLVVDGFNLSTVSDAR